MSELSLEKIKELVDTLKGHADSLSHREDSVFSIGGRGYYENPTSDVLAFFLDSGGSHGLGDLAVEALFNALSDEPGQGSIFTPSHPGTLEKPQREEVTAEGRIDLLLEGGDWLMVIENKIHHHKDNPAKSYREYAEGEAKGRGKQSICVLLSPDGKVPKDKEWNGWLGLSYPKLIKHLRIGVAENFMGQPLSKWLVILREFILNLEEVMSNSMIPNETTEYVLDNCRKIVKLNDMRKEILGKYMAEIKDNISKDSHFKDENLKARIYSWEEGPALSFWLPSWESSATLCFDGIGNEGSVSLWIDIHKIGDQWCDEAVGFLKEREPACGSFNQGESTRKALYCKDTARLHHTNDKEKIVRRLVEKLKVLEEFEKKFR